MQGYDIKKAEQFILGKIKDSKQFDKQELDQLAPMIIPAINIDLELIDQLQGQDAVEYYDDDDAFEAICDALVKQYHAEDELEMLIAQFVEAFMDYQEDFLEDQGLLQWDGPE